MRPLLGRQVSQGISMDRILIEIVIWVSLIIFFITNSWRFSEEISEFVREYRGTKKKALKFSLCGAALKRRGKLTLWNGLGQVATDEDGLYYSSVCLPFLFFPWSKISVLKSTRLNKSHYSIVKLTGFPEISCLVPKRFELESWMVK